VGIHVYMYTMNKKSEKKKTSVSMPKELDADIVRQLSFGEEKSEFIRAAIQFKLERCPDVTEPNEFSLTEHNRFDTSVMLDVDLITEIKDHLEWGEGNGMTGWIRDAIRRYLMHLSDGPDERDYVFGDCTNQDDTTPPLRNEC